MAVPEPPSTGVADSEDPAAEARSGETESVSSSNRPLCRKAMFNSASSNLPNGSRFERIVPLNRIASCGIILTLSRKSSKLTLSISIPLITIVPLTLVVKRSSVRHNVDFPLPVRPQIPTLSFGLMEKVTFDKTFGPSRAYLTLKSLTTTSPSVGHAAGGFPFSVAGGSDARVAYCMTLSKLFNSISSSFSVRTR